jgi:D-alanyl-D-alanine carboxypeptidase/D-alanyl-D-alanine-endopeptidase (penicillin-binding protein 4)
MRRSLFVLLVVSLLVIVPVFPASARAPWKRRIDRLIGGGSMSVMVRDGGAILYRHKPSARRAPASGEKLLMSMALLDRLDPATTFQTRVAAATVKGSVVAGDLWLLGRGDPTITGGGSYGKSLPFEPTRMGRLAHKIKRSGITKITGGIGGSINYFAHDWWAPGWKQNFPAEEIPLPSALTFEGNKAKGHHVSDPEFRAARSLTRRLEAIGVKVRRKPHAGYPPPGLQTVATVRSVPLSVIMRFMNRSSSNFFAEVLGKRLAVRVSGGAGTIANGAAAIETWARAHNVEVDAYDSSGLSYSNRVSPNGFTRLLEATEDEPHFAILRSTLAGADQGTLDNRLQGVKVRAKTGTLTYISSLSGWVWLRRTKTWAAFSIMSNGYYKSTAASIEDAIVRELTRNAR